MSDELVLVTGGSGFIAAHCMIQLLNAGYRVRTTVRSLKREGDVRAMIRVGGVEASDKLSFIATDLGSDKNWLQAAEGCAYVLHVASPFPVGSPKDENELIIPAREGTLRVLRAARDAGVKRVVVTSSFAAVGYGHEPSTKPFDETTWTNLNGTSVPAYMKSKAIAERAGWDFMTREGGALEMATVNPVAVFGPVLAPDFSSSIEIVSRLMDGSIPVCPNICFGAVDVRDVASLHLTAMTHPAAKGERFLAVAGEGVCIPWIAKLLRDRLGASAAKVPKRTVPDWVIRVGALFNGSMKEAAHHLGNTRMATGEKAQRVLGWRPRSNEEAILATAESLLRLGIVNGNPKGS